MVNGQTGRGEETRTPDLLLPKQVRYQLRYSPASHDATGPGRAQPMVSARNLGPVASDSVDGADHHDRARRMLQHGTADRTEQQRSEPAVTA